jgi:hypothetical protein
MKCVNCGTDNNLQERTENAGRCKNCNHHFAFDPQAGSKFTDVFFKRSIEAISNENTLFFTKKQFLYLLERRLKVKENFSIVGLLAFCAVLALFWGIGILIFIGVLISRSKSRNCNPKERINAARVLQLTGLFSVIGSIIYSLNLAGSNEMKFFVFLIGIGVGLFLIYFGQKQISRSNYIPQKFSHVTSREVNDCLNRWTRINGSVEKLLPPPREEISNIEVSSDISAYSFDRLLVCETAEIAQFLIANNFHFEHNCAVLSVTGYPQSIFNTVMEMLRRNSDLKVYAFHNASPSGVGLINHLRTSNNWFPNSDVIIYDLGLFPRHIFSSKNMFIVNSSESATAAKQMPAAVRQGLSADEIAWLEEGNYVELESFSPQRLLRVASRGVANSQSFSLGESFDGDDGDGSLADGGDAYIFIYDSFG